MSRPKSLPIRRLALLGAAAALLTAGRAMRNHLHPMAIGRLPV